MKLATTDGCGGRSICTRPGVGTRGSTLLMERDTLPLCNVNALFTTHALGYTPTPLMNTLECVCFIWCRLIRI